MHHKQRFADTFRQSRAKDIEADDVTRLRARGFYCRPGVVFEDRILVIEGDHIASYVRRSRASQAVDKGVIFKIGSLESINVVRRAPDFTNAVSIHERAPDHARCSGNADLKAIARRDAPLGQSITNHNGGQREDVKTRVRPRAIGKLTAPPPDALEIDAETTSPLSFGGCDFCESDCQIRKHGARVARPGIPSQMTRYAGAQALNRVRRSEIVG